MPSANGRSAGGAHRIAAQNEAAKRLRQEVIDRADRHQVQVVALWFTDILGQLKSFVVPRHQLEEALEEGLGFDGSSVEGFARIFESDLLAVPDPRTFAILPFQVDGQVRAVSSATSIIRTADRTRATRAGCCGRTSRRSRRRA
jgi:glutamine synthetase